MNPAIKFSGDCGDAIHTMCVARNIYAATGNRVTMLADECSALRELFIPRLPLLSSLIEAQPYIDRLGVYNGEPCVDLTQFRRYHSRTRPLAYGQTRAFNDQSEIKLPMDFSPWADCEGHSYAPGRICIARSHRYRNYLFDWKAFVDRNRDDCLFLGSAEEHKDMEARVGRVEWVRTPNLYEAACLIKSARGFLGNQSSLLNIALAIGQSVVCELNTFVSDVVIDRPNATYCYDGHFTFEGIDFEPSQPKDGNYRDLVAQRAIINSILKF